MQHRLLVASLAPCRKPPAMIGRSFDVIFRAYR